MKIFYVWLGLLLAAIGAAFVFAQPTRQSAPKHPSAPYNLKLSEREPDAPSAPNKASDPRITEINDHIVKWKRNLDEFQGFAEALLIESEKAHTDYHVIMSVIDIESEFNPRAVSNRCAVGLMQNMPDTAKFIAEKLEWHDYVPPVVSAHKGRCYNSLGSLGEPIYNLRVGVMHLRGMRNQFPDIAVALRAYNRGERYAKQVRLLDRYPEKIALNVITLLEVR